MILVKKGLVDLEARVGNTKDSQYYDYYKQHTNNVVRAAHQFLDKIGDSVILLPLKNSLLKLVEVHDNSKLNNEEWEPYREYFYGDNESYNISRDFDIAWNIHQKNNPHHWQYWVLIRDSGDIIPLDMPIEYVAEMLCDWHSFSVKDPQSTACSWYGLNKEKMLLSNGTKVLIDLLLPYFNEPLQMEVNISGESS